MCCCRRCGLAAARNRSLISVVRMSGPGLRDGRERPLAARAARGSVCPDAYKKIPRKTPQGSARFELRSFVSERVVRGSTGPSPTPKSPSPAPLPPLCHPRSRFLPLPLCGACPFVGYCGLFSINYFRKKKKSLTPRICPPRTKRMTRTLPSLLVSMCTSSAWWALHISTAHRQ